MTTKSKPIKLDLKSENEMLKQQLKAANLKIKEYTDQINELESDIEMKDQLIESLEKEMESIMSQSKPQPQPVLPNGNKPVIEDEKKDNKISKINKKKDGNRGIIVIIGGSIIGTRIATLLALKKYVIIVVDNSKDVIAKSKQLTGQILNEFKISANQNAINISYSSSIKILSKYSSIYSIIDTSHNQFKRNVLKQIVLNIANNKNKNDIMIVTHSVSLTINDLSQMIPTAMNGNIIGINLLYFGLSPHNSKCIEIIPSWNTSLDIIEKCKALVFNDLGRQFVVIKDSCSFISNRLIMVFINEAFTLLERSVSSSTDIDNIMKTCFINYGINCGPFELADRIGLDVCYEILNDLYKEYGDNKYIPNSMLKQYVRSGKYGRKRACGVYNYNKKQIKVKNKPNTK